MIEIATYFYNDFDDKIDRFIQNLFNNNLQNNPILFINNGGEEINEEKLSGLNYNLINLKRNINPGGAKASAISNSSHEWLWIWDMDDDYTLNIPTTRFVNYDVINIPSSTKTFTPKHNKRKYHSWTFCNILRGDFARSNQILRGYHDWSEEGRFWSDLIRHDAKILKLDKKMGFVQKNRSVSSCRNVISLKSYRLLLREYDSYSKFDNGSILKGSKKKIKYLIRMREREVEKHKLKKLGCCA